MFTTHKYLLGKKWKQVFGALFPDNSEHCFIVEYQLHVAVLLNFCFYRIAEACKAGAQLNGLRLTGIRTIDYIIILILSLLRTRDWLRVSDWDWDWRSYRGNIRLRKYYYSVRLVIKEVFDLSLLFFRLLLFTKALQSDLSQHVRNE